MSDPVAKGEIEDVIASIRRLVSSAPDAHRLVLTEAQRVDRPPAPPEEAGGPRAAHSEPTADPGTLGDVGSFVTHDDDLLLEQAVAELEAELRVDSQPEGENFAGDGHYDPWEPVEPAAAAAPDALDRIDMQIEAELQAEAEIVMFRRASEGGIHLLRTVRGSATPAGSLAEDVPAAELTREPHADPAGELSGNLAGDAPHGAASALSGGEALDARSAAPDNLAADDAAENVARPDAESLLDERDLRALVAEVLREELKGPLGERITRNVRKLVRREIAQALSGYDLG